MAHDSWCELVEHANGWPWRGSQNPMDLEEKGMLADEIGEIHVFVGDRWNLDALIAR